MDPDLIDDVAQASAAYLVNTLPDILKLPATQRYERLVSHFEAAIAAYRHGHAARIPEPSNN